jgi:DDE superfamily endonuclease
MGSAAKAFLGAAEQRFRAYVERLAPSLSHADRHEPLRGYLTGLMLPGARKCVEPMAALLAPQRVRQTHQSLHHLVADAPWEDAAVLKAVREYSWRRSRSAARLRRGSSTTPACLRKGGIRSAWRANIAGSWASRTTARSR